MPVLNFTLESKIAWILERDEGQTIRPVGKRVYRVGDRLYLYAHQRSKNCRKLGETVCSEVVPITLKKHGSLIVIYDNLPQWTCRVGWPDKKKEQLELDDGFKNEKAFDSFFINTYKLKPGDSLEMVIIKWRGFRQLGEK